MKKVGDKYQELFTKQRVFPEEKLQVNVRPFPIPDDVPYSGEIERALRGMKKGKAPGPSKIRVEDLFRWMEAAKSEEPQPELWEKVVEIVQVGFRTGELPSVLPNSLLVLIPKSDVTQFRGIGLLEVLWKLISTIIHKRIVGNVIFHDGIHGFRSGRGTGTAILETKLLMQEAACTDRKLYQIFLDLTKAYDTLDRERTLEILEQYGVGPCIIRLLRKFWQHQKLVPRQSGFFGDAFIAERGVTQGDIVSPTIFNIVVDAVLRVWHEKMNLVVNAEAEAIVPDTAATFYADDGRLASYDAVTLQEGLTLITALFTSVGLDMSEAKTKAMISAGNFQYHSICDAAYKRRMTGEGEEFKTRKSRKVSCPTCDDVVSERYLSTHLLHQHNIVQERAAPELQSAPQSYTVSMPRRRMFFQCPVPGCPGQAAKRFGLRRHFMFRHPEDTIIIEEEGALQRCGKCCMFLTGLTNVAKHQTTKNCQKGSSQREKREEDATRKQAGEIIFYINGREIENVPEFKYLGRWLAKSDNDLKAVRANIQKARARWSGFSRVLTRKGANRKVMSVFNERSFSLSFCLDQKLGLSPKGKCNLLPRSIINARAVSPGAGTGKMKMASGIAQI